MAKPQFYYGVLCAKCYQPIPLFEAKARPVKFAGPGKLRVKCPRCGHRGDYPTEKVLHYRADVLH